MPLLFTKKEPHYAIIIWHIEETEAFFASVLGFASDRKHPKRRLEHLAGRFLLKELKADFPFEKMVLSPEGKPELNDQSLRFSISHSFPYAAAIISTTKSVGVDIQVYVEKIKNLQSKFLSEEEQTLFNNQISGITLAWTAKEALFKYYGLGAVDFKGDMPIRDVLWYEQHAKINMELNKTREACRLSGFTTDEFAVAWL